MYAYPAMGITLAFRLASISEIGTVAVKDSVSGSPADVHISMTYANAAKARLGSRPLPAMSQAQRGQCSSAGC